VYFLAIEVNFLTISAAAAQNEWDGYGKAYSNEPKTIPPPGACPISKAETFFSSDRIGPRCAFGPEISVSAFSSWWVAKLQAWDTSSLPTGLE
jgi:hypothetical protein